jgi:hypothetical protein
MTDLERAIKAAEETHKAACLTLTPAERHTFRDILSTMHTREIARGLLAEFLAEFKELGDAFPADEEEA